MVAAVLATLAIAPLGGQGVAYEPPPPDPCRRRACQRRVHMKRYAKPYRSWLRSTRACESGGNYRTATGNGYWGAYQFDLQTWQSVGGVGYPHQAPWWEQDYRAAKLVRRRGTAPWPVCG
jgi:hypothetical protein